LVHQYLITWQPGAARYSLRVAARPRRRARSPGERGCQCALRRRGRRLFHCGSWRRRFIR